MMKNKAAVTASQKDKLAKPKPKAKPQTAAQKKKVEEYKSTQKSLDKTKRIKNPSLRNSILNRPTTKDFVEEFKDKDQRISRFSLRTGGRSAMKQEKAAVARGASKRKAITGKASDYQQSRGKKK
jgi:hypothetical protein